jgi:hypothetical protein
MQHRLPQRANKTIDYSSNTEGIYPPFLFAWLI